MTAKCAIRLSCATNPTVRAVQALLERIERWQEIEDRNIFTPAYIAYKEASTLPDARD